eukprot:TRINITY_DN2661_c0_g1_i1.p1 TRINITY_DN2661_c0_g1~~TRINITY_DN2661_c0_g1_i1.p1  ORF type:complete len:559 (+),score=31.69 TRINITY_DN2661_c0_g1_i1:77-1753(+)
MIACFLGLVVIISVPATIGVTPVEFCQPYCNHPTEDPTQQACGFNWTSYASVPNSLCDFGSVYGCIYEYSGNVLFQPYAFVNAGTCGCPNNCLQSVGHGKCGDSGCVCATGWAGPDCSLVDCTSSNANDCSGHGQCSQSLGMCLCDDGYTLPDCSGTTEKLVEITPTQNGSEYSNQDHYGNNHPIFNISTIAQIHINMDPANFLFMLDSMHEENRTWVNATMTFDNGIVRNVDANIGMEIRGAASRFFAKKSWNIKMEDKWFHIKKFSLKSASMDVSYLRERLSIAVLQSLASPVYRGSFAVVYINKQFMGLFHMLEEIDNNFLTSRLGTDQGLLYKCPSRTTSGPYYTCTPENDAAKNMDLFNELMSFVQSPNSTNPQWVKGISSLLDTSTFLKVLVYESVSSAWDGFAENSNNYYWFYNDQISKFQLIRYDLDCSFGGLDSSKSVYLNDIFFSNDGSIAAAYLAVDEFRQAYKQMYCSLLKYFNPNSPFGTLMQQLHGMMLSVAAWDSWHNLDFGWTFDNVENSLNSSFVLNYHFNFGLEDFVQKRFDYVSQVLQC